MIKTSIIDPDLALRIVRQSPVIAFDTETDGLLVTSKAVGWVITDWEHSIYVPVRHEAGGNIPNAEEFEHALNGAFADRHRAGLRTVGHHIGFDLRVGLRHSVRILGPLEDTMINESLIDDTTVGYGLDDLSARHGVTVKKGDELYQAIAARFGGLPDRKSMDKYWRMPGDEPVVLEYATGDGVSTLEVWEKQQRLLDENEVRVPWQLECDLLPYVARIHHRGMRVDADYAANVRVDLSAQIEEAKRKFTPGFNVRSPAEVEALYRANGYTDEQFARTEKGKPSFKEKWLEKNAIGENILQVRRLEKAGDSFITPLVDTHNVLGRVHPILHQSKSDEYGVAGARFSCSEPNLQAYPKRNKAIGKVVRPLIAPDDGMLIEEADAMQQEPRFFTHYSEDEALVAGYTRGDMDIHDRASEVLNLDRDYAKRLGLGMLTMMSPKTLAMHMDYSLEQAKRDHRLFLDDAFPAIRDFQQTAVRVYKRRGYVKSILGRRAWCRDPRFAYQAVSRIIQNSGGDHLKTCLLRACQYEDIYPGLIQILLTIHDSLIWQRDPGALKQLVELVKILENVPHEPQFNLLVPIPFEVGSGTNWSEASYGAKLKGKKGWEIDISSVQIAA
jgi:DNA polymerase-1